MDDDERQDLEAKIEAQEVRIEELEKLLAEAMQGYEEAVGLLKEIKDLTKFQ